MIKAIFAVDYWGGMGFNGSLPWPTHKEDFQYFKDNTINNIVIMGRRTWNDPKMPKPLPNRICYVATNTKLNNSLAKTISGPDIDQKILNIQKNYPKLHVWIIGGPSLLLQTRHILDELHITHMKGSYKNDCKLDLSKFLLGFRVTSAKASTDKDCNWMVYKNIDIFR
jgi:dihydrofolate reductase